MFALLQYGQSTNDAGPAVIEGRQELPGVATIMYRNEPGGISYFAGLLSGGKELCSHGNIAQ